MSNYSPTIGLEVHCELKTRTKMFCDSPNNPSEAHPNVNVCPVCLAHPGALPVINKDAVRHIIRIGLALGGEINPVTKFDRKNYFYPDLPKAYQISQYDEPIVKGGMLNGVHLTRIHLEEDAGKLVHAPDGKSTLVDFNRAGVPLMELVTEPDMHEIPQAVAFAKELQLVLRYLGVSDADLEHGQMRFDANISLSKDSSLGKKVEIKNLNSFSALESALKYEISRQTDILEEGGTIKQETRGWDEAKQKTLSQRSKEEAHDYRYFPEPDLPPFETKVFNIEELKAGIPELPEAKRKRFAAEYGLNNTQADSLVLVPEYATYFENAVSELGEIESSDKEKTPTVTLYNYFTSDLVGLLNETGIEFSELKITPEHLAHLVALIHGGKVASRGAKDILKKMFETGLDPEDILQKENLHTISDEKELEKTILEVINENEAAVNDYKKGKEASLQFLIGKAMAKLRGRGNPGVLRDIFKRVLV